MMVPMFVMVLYDGTCGEGTGGGSDGCEGEGVAGGGGGPDVGGCFDGDSGDVGASGSVGDGGGRKLPMQLLSHSNDGAIDDSIKWRHSRFLVGVGKQ